MWCFDFGAGGLSRSGKLKGLIRIIEMLQGVWNLFLVLSFIR